MIKANELRIGNLVVHDSLDQGERIVRVVQIREKDFIAEGDEVFPTSKEHGEMEGIPLTPEILEKCGFARYENGTIKGYRLLVNKPDEDYFQISGSLKGWHLRIGIDWVYPHPYKPFLYIHQLLNLYYALTGEELEVKL